MRNLNLTAATVGFSGMVKPVLVKILPIHFLRQVKKNIINYAMAKLSVNFLPFSRAANPDGINLIGYIRGEIGLGQSCRLVAGSLQSANIDFTVFNYEQISAMRFNDHSWEHKITNTTPYNINLFHINPYEMPLAFFRIGRNIWDKRYNIAFWLWELEQFPPEWENAFGLVDEIWAPSEFTAESIQKATGKPVHVVPYALTTPDCRGYNRTHFYLPENRFLFLCMYDCNSTMERKNPMGAIEAYKRAFSENDTGIGLVIKVNNSQQRDIQVITESLAGYPYIYIITDVLDRQEVNALIACVDVYISLHRAEGFGLVPAEAMLLGTPVIATNWSSNVEFMDSGVACMVEYTFTTIERDCGPYKTGNRWAEPDINQAAKFMRRLCEDKAFRVNMANKAKVHIQNKFSPERTGKLIISRVAEIYRMMGKQNREL